MPDVWHLELTKGLETGEAPLHSWWTVLDDPKLTELIERGAQGNLDLKMAFARLKTARSTLGIAESSRYPIVGAAGIAEVIDPGFTALVDVGQIDRKRAGFDASWEIDLWGRVSRQIESAEASFEASIENFRDVLVLLYSEIAVNYLQLRSLQARIRYAESNVQLQQNTLSLTQGLFQAQITSELDVRQAELNLERTSSLIPALRILAERTAYRIAVLLGEQPGALQDELAVESPIPEPPDKVVIDFPAEILRQRPDIRRAERELAAQSAQIGVATAALYPQFSLSGTLGWASIRESNIFNGNRNFWSFGPVFQWDIFNGGLIRNDIEAEKAATEEALAFYERVVLLAMEEVESALVGYTQELDRRDMLRRSVTAAQRSVELVETLYRTGVTDFQNVLNMQRALVQQQDELAVSEGKVVEYLVRLYEALGGGWQPTEAGTEPTETSEEGR